MNIIKFPNPMLITVTYKITVFGEELKTLLDAMYETMKANRGIGLAANQVGLLHRMFVMEGPEGRINIVNPYVISKSKISANLKEGCLSAPGEFIVVPQRPNWVQIEYQNELGENKTAVFNGIYSVCVCHEMEHLDGNVFFKNPSLSRAIRKNLIKKWEK